MKKQKILNSYFKGKEQIKPIFGLLYQRIGEFGNDITIKGCKNYISFTREKCFAVVYPLKEYIKLEFAGSGEPQDERVYRIDSFRWSGRINRGIKIKTLNNINRNLISLLRTAYQIS